MTASRRAPRAAVALPGVWLATAAAAGCVGERERLDVPKVTLDVTSVPEAPGARVSGAVEATDGSGLISMAVYACTSDSVFRENESLDGEHSVAFNFSLHVSSAVAVGAPVEVYAVAFDDQGFVAEASQVVYVGGVSGGAAAALCRRLRPAASRVTLPTAPAP